MDVINFRPSDGVDTIRGQVLFEGRFYLFMGSLCTLAG